MPTDPTVLDPVPLDLSPTVLAAVALDLEPTELGAVELPVTADGALDFRYSRNSGLLAVLIEAFA